MKTLLSTTTKVKTFIAAIVQLLRDKMCIIACVGTLLSALFLLPVVRTCALAVMQMLIGRPLNEYAYWQWQFMWLAVGGITFFGIITISETAWFAKFWNRANTADTQKFTGGGYSLGYLFSCQLLSS